MLNLNFNPFPVLNTQRLVLRSITKNDADNLFRLRSNKKIMQFINRPLAKSVTDAEDFIELINESLKNNNGITWAISLKNNAGLIGTIGLWRLIKEHYRAEIGYMLNADFQRAGIMHEVIQPVLYYGFDIMNLHSIEAHVNPDNNASIKLLQKSGFIKEAHFKENFYFDGRFLDSEVYSLLTQQYNVIRKQSKHQETGKEFQ